MAHECDGCREADAGKYTRGEWHVCADCRAKYDQRKEDAKAELLLRVYTPEAHLYRVSGTAYGSDGDFGSFPVKITRPIEAEDVCQWCAVRKALNALDPWAFEGTLSYHGPNEAHDADDADISEWFIDGGKTGKLIIEDLGPVSEDRWGRRFGWPTLPGMASKRKARAA